MIEDKKKALIRNIIKYSVATLVAALLCILALYLRDVFNISDKKELFRAFSDAFCIPGLFLVLIGVLISLSNEGALDFLGYAFKFLRQALIPFNKDKNAKQTYYEYVQNKKKLKGYGFIYIVGLIFLAVGIIFTILYYKA